MKTIVLVLIGSVALLITAGCEEEGHEHHHYGGAYDGNYQSYGHGEYPGYPAASGAWERSDDWHR